MDLKDLKELEKIIKFCRKNGITRIKEGVVELDIAPQALFPESDYKKKKNLTLIDSPIETEKKYSDEDALFWSSAGIPEEAVNG